MGGRIRALIGKRLLAAIPVLWGVTLVTFLVINVMPGNAASQLLGANATPDQVAELEAKLHRTPTEDEVARHLAMPVEDLRAIYSQLSTVNVAALDELLGGGDDRPGGVSLGDTLGDDRTLDPASSIEAAETKFLLARAIECLGERERIVVVLYYYEGMTLAEIGRVLGVTESRISQMHTAAMVRLRTRLMDAERV